MKKKYITLMLLISGSVTAFSNPIDLDKAYKIAEKYASGSGGFELAFKSISKKGINNDKSAPLYIFNRGNNEGFVIISGDDCLPEVLGYTEKGSYNPDSLPPHLLDWIESYSVMIEAAQENKMPPLVKTRNTKQKQSVQPIITAHWSQGAPYNNLCPYIKGTTQRAVTGCVATSASQIAYYWRKEASERTQVNTPTYDYGDAPVKESIPAGTPYHWELMREWYNSSTPHDMNMAVATLMSVMGTTTWLSYGYSTGGWTKNLVETYRTQFNLDSKYTYKSGIDQQIWEDMIYEELIMGRPMAYHGQVPNGGAHAVVLDGYDANTNLYHFNFGWGGSGNGYYTVNDVNGMNGYSAWQGMAYNIHPMVNSLKGKINTETLYTQMHNNIEFEVSNTGTAPYKGVYVFLSSKPGAPTDLAKAKLKNLSQIIQPNETAKMSFSHRIATSLQPQYVYLTDDNLMVLDSMVMTVQEQSPEYILNGWNAKGQHEGDITNIYRDNEAEVVLSLSTPENSTPGFPRIQAILYEYDNNENKYIEKYRKTVEGLCSNKGVTDFNYVFDNLEKDVKYKAELVTSVVGSNKPILTNDISTETVFILKGETLKGNKSNPYDIAFEGNWDENTFNRILNENGDSIVSIDLRKVTDIEDLLTSEKSNVLFYTKDYNGGSETNIVNNGICKKLVLTAGFDFNPIEEFTAETACLKIKAEDTQKWMYITVPYNCPVPEGVIAREIKSMSGVSISSMVEVTGQMMAGVPYLIKFSSTGDYVFTAENVTVTNKNNASNENIGISYLNVNNDRRFRVLNNETTQKFALTTYSIPAFSGYLDYNYDVSTRVSSFLSKDNALKMLSEAISYAEFTAKEFSSMVDESVLIPYYMDIDEAKKVFTLQGSNDDINEAADILDEKTEAFKANIISIENEVDLTDIILENPSFEDKRTTGWDIERITGQLSYVRTSSESLDLFMSGVDNNCYFHTFSNTGKGGVTISQTLNNIPNGYYRVEALVAADENDEVSLFANDSISTFTGDDMGGRYFHNISIDSVCVENNSLTIGTKGSGDWYKADNFRLVFLGKNNTTGIKENINTSDDINVWSENGNIIIETENETTVRIYTTNGLLIKEFVCNGYSQVNGIPDGIYIINGKKIYVK